MNSAGIGVRGLSIAPGKIDPGFRPNPLALVVTNHSKRSIDLKAGDKIAVIAFAQTSAECTPTDSNGWSQRKIEGYSNSLWSRFVDRLSSIDIFNILGYIFMSALGAAIVLIVQYFFGKVGINKL